MPFALLALLACQLIGETLARVLASGFGLGLPGPVLGMILMLGALRASARLTDTIRPVAQGILAHLSLLFVPAGVGVVGHLATLGGQTVAILLAVIASTILAIAAGAVTFTLVARMTGSADD